MSYSILQFLRSDHQRLDKLYAESFSNGNNGRFDRYEAFREGLLRHIAVEEKILFPALRQMKDQEVEILLKRLHADHAAISAILVLSPTLENANRIETLLVPHNQIEEGTSGIYELCDRLPPSIRDRLLMEVEAYPKVMIKPCNDTEVALRNAEKMFDEALKAREGDL